MKTSLKRALTIRKTVVSVLIMGLFLSQMPPAMAIVLNCDSVDPANLTTDQKKLWDGGKFDAVSTYATQMKDRWWTGVIKTKRDFILANAPFTAQCPEIEGYANVNGVKTADGFYSAYRNQFAEELEKIFQNKASNSSLTPIAIMLFDEYSRKQDMLCGVFHYYLLHTPENPDPTNIIEEPDSSQLAINTRYLQCKNALDLAVNSSEQLMMNHIKSTAAAKKAALLVEKYKAINKKLIDLNNSVARMYAFFQTFANKLLFKADKQMIGM